MSIGRAALVVGLLVATPTPAQEPAPSEEIVVTGIRGMWSLEGKRIRAAQSAFAAGQPRYAPGARLIFQIILKTDRPADGLALMLRKGDETLSVRLDDERRFELPTLDSDDWRLVANRTPADIGLRLWILSPGSSEADRRLGDLRLYCRVGWALRRDQFSFFQRAAFDAIGGCDTRRVKIYTSASRPLGSATLTLPDGSTRPLAIAPPRKFLIPIGDKALPDDARVRLAYR